MRNGACGRFHSAQFLQAGAVLCATAINPNERDNSEVHAHRRRRKIKSPPLPGILRTHAASHPKSRPRSRTLPPPQEFSASRLRRIAPPLPPPPMPPSTVPHPAAHAARERVQSALPPETDRSSGSGSVSLLPPRTGSPRPQSHLRDPPPAGIRRPRSESPAAQILVRSPSASRPSLQSFPDTPPPASQFRWSAPRCSTIPPADRSSAPRPIRRQSPAACVAQFSPPAPLATPAPHHTNSYAATVSRPSPPPIPESPSAQYCSRVAVLSASTPPSAYETSASTISDFLP